jgi:septum formation protein
MTAPRLILASTSRYRSALLQRLGVAFEACAPLCNEDELKDARRSPSDLAGFLACEKAMSLKAAYPDAYVLGGDQLVDLEGRILGKSGTSEGAQAQLRALSGRTHRLITALALVCPDGRVLAHLDVHSLTMRVLSDADIERYVAREQPLDCAGSYKAEAGGIALLSRIEGEDFSAITGLPLIALTTLLRQEGFAVP